MQAPIRDCRCYDRPREPLERIAREKSGDVDNVIVYLVLYYIREKIDQASPLRCLLRGVLLTRRSSELTLLLVLSAKLNSSVATQ